ncbi:MAG: 30S ribosomal protein S9 [Thermoplasmata archaeon]|nr:30S ribosomal protein S9 [Thermoplasmata archaeon]MBU1159454.1 30S ribosomal protein S9 [Candidatus Thermoplasmatota archaeon]TFG68012.1 MAG: 30S ribosomal protein S9 [Methanomassiliicoccus sp.]
MKVVVASGKRKSAVARASVRKGKGLVRVNNVPIEIFEPALARTKIMEPLTLAGELSSKVNIDVNVQGGGIMGQASASRTAIAKGMVQFLEDKDLESMFMKYDRSLLVSDPRRKLPKTPLGRGARKNRQKSYR